MKILCPSCKRQITVPPDKVALPNLKAKCPGCQTVFAVAEASIAPAAPPAPEPPVALKPAAKPLAATAAAKPAVAAAARTLRPGGTTNWRRCANHPQSKAESVCHACKKGFCGECSKKIQNAYVCPVCDGLATSLAEEEAREARARQRARSMRDELATIAGYPLNDVVAYGALSVFVWVFALMASIAAFGGGMGTLLSQGVLMAYAFTAVNRVSAGNLKDYMPNIGDVGDLATPLRLGLAALLVSGGPFILLAFLYGNPIVADAGGGDSERALEVRTPQAATPAPPEVPAAASDDEDEKEESTDPAPSASPAVLADALAEEPHAGRSALTLVLFVVAGIWWLLYAPVALTVAAISRSFGTTINPLVGLDSIRKMGAVYWQAMGIYTLIAAVQIGLGAALGLIPFLGGVMKAFVDSYAFLAIGCTLGLAVFKRAPELGLD